MGATILFTSLQLQLAEPEHWSNGSCRRIPRGMGAAILFLADQVMCDWLNHTTWFHSRRALPRSMEFESILLHFFTQYSLQYAMLAVWWLQIHGYISPYTSGILLSWKTKNSLYFLASACEHLSPSHSCLVNCANCEQIPSKYVADWSVWKAF